MTDHDPQRESPDFGQEVRASDGVDALPGRLERYGSAKSRAIDQAHFMRQFDSFATVSARVEKCGTYLLFRHYYTVDKMRLHAANFCKYHLLCPLCAIRRGAKALKAYLDRFEVIRAEQPRLKPFLVTLTVKDGPDLRERFEHLYSAQKELWKRKQRGRGCVLDVVHGAVWSYEFKRGSGSGLWHPHLHMIALAPFQPDQDALRDEWRHITGDSFIVDVRPISQEDPVSGFLEVFKYAVKFADQDHADTLHCWKTFKGVRLIGSAGCFRGVHVPDDLCDESGLDELPYVELLAAWHHGRYHLRQLVPIGE